MTQADESTSQIPSLRLPNGGEVPSEGSHVGFSAPALPNAAPVAESGRVSSVSGNSIAAAPRPSAISSSSMRCASTTGCGWPDEVRLARHRHVNALLLTGSFHCSYLQMRLSQESDNLS